MDRARLAAALLFLVGVAGCTSSALPPPADARVAATLGPVAVPLTALLWMAEERAGVGELPRDGEGFEEVRSRLLNERLVDEVLNLEAAARGVNVPDATLDATIAERVGAPPDPSQLAPIVARYGTEAAWRMSVSRRLRARAAGALLRTEMEAGITVTDAQIEEAIPRVASLLVVPERLRLLQLFDVEPAPVRAFHARLLAGEQFTAVASSAGQDPELGWLSVDAAPPLIVEAARSLAPGEFTPVLRSPLGYHVFLLLDRRPASEPTREALQEEAAARLRAEVVERRMEAWLAEKMGKLGLTVHEDVLHALRCCRDGAPYVAPKKDL